MNVGNCRHCDSALTFKLYILFDPFRHRHHAISREGNPSKRRPTLPHQKILHSSRQAQADQVQIPYGDALKIIITFMNTHLKGRLLPVVSTETPDFILEGERLLLFARPSVCKSQL